jgi:pimeloyl-ACP methyl ester carboxylesterase
VIEPDSRYVVVDGVRPRYTTGGGGKEAIVFIHGFSSSLFTWRECLAPISTQYRVFALDLKGFGFSGKPQSDYSIGEYVDFVIHFMDAVGLEKATLCGNSMGGNIAWRAALQYPKRVDRLILVDSSGYASPHSGVPFIMKLGRLPGAEMLFSILTTRGRIRSSLASAYYDDAKVTEDAVNAYYYPTRTPGAMYAPLARLRSGRSENEKWQDSISELSLPTCIIWGENDTWVPPEDALRFHTDISGSMLVMIPECGHLPEEEEPERFVAAVLDFMSEKNREILFTRAPVAEAIS